MRVKAVATAHHEIPFWSIFQRDKRAGFPDEELLSVYRDYGVIRKSDRDDNWNRAGSDLGAYQLVEPGDLVVNKMKAWQGSLGVSKFRGIVSPAYFVYRQQRPDVVLDFLHHVLRSQHFIDQYAVISKGVRPGQWDLQPEKLDELMVPLPPLPTQRAIAAYLDRETAQIDTMATDLDELVATLEERRRLATDPLAGLGDTYRRTELGSDVFALLASRFDPTWKVSRFSFEFAELDVRVGDEDPGLPLSISEFRGVEARPETGQKVGENVAKYKRLEVGQLAINPMWLTNGGVAVSRLKGFISPDYAAYKISAHLNPDFVHHLVRSDRYVSTFKVLGKGVRPNAQRLTNAELGKVPIPVPPLDEQRRIVEHLDTVTAEIVSMIADAQELKALLNERRSALITEVVTGRKEVPTS